MINYINCTNTNNTLTIYNVKQYHMNNKYILIKFYLKIWAIKNARDYYLRAFIISFIFYFSTKRLFPVIASGFFIPISSISVGTISQSLPPSASLYLGSAFTSMKGTGFVVCAV